MLSGLSSKGESSWLRVGSRSDELPRSSPPEALSAALRPMPALTFREDVRVPTAKGLDLRGTLFPEASRSPREANAPFEYN
jgi:hypothetical protein